MPFQCLSHAWENMFEQSPIGNFAEFLLVASRSYQKQNFKLAKIVSESEFFQI